MADETPETTPETMAAAEDAAAALEEVETKRMTKEEARAARATRLQGDQAEETAETLEAPKDDGETHVVSDLMAASTRLFGVPPEVVAGAASHAGLEMTSECSIPALANHIQAFMAEPA